MYILYIDSSSSSSYHDYSAADNIHFAQVPLLEPLDDNISCNDLFFTQSIPMGAVEDQDEDEYMEDEDEEMVEDNQVEDKGPQLKFDEFDEVDLD